MLSLGLPSKKEQQYILFDIRSASIGVGIAVFSANSNSMELIWNKRLEYGYKTDVDYNRYVRTMYATLLEVGMKLTSEGFKVAQEKFPDFSVKHAGVYCMLSSPWFMGAVHIETETKEKPFQSSDAVLQELQKRGLSKILERQEIKSWQAVMGTPVLLEAHHDSITLEGYPVQNYAHATVNEMSTQCYYSIVSTSVQDHIKEVLERVLPNHELHFSTSTRVFSSLCAKKGVKNQRSIFFEIGGDLTSLGSVKNGKIINTVVIPLGTNHILKVLAPKAQSVSEAKSAFDLLQKKNTSEISFESLPETVQGALLTWKEQISNSLRTLTHGITPPPDVWMVVDTPWFALYKLALEIPLKKGVIQQNSDMRIQHLSEKTDDKKETLAGSDPRLCAYARLLQSCTSKNSLCYTNNVI